MSTTSSDPPLPSTASIALATGILCAVTGYFIGQASSLGLFSSASASSQTQSRSRKSTSAKESWPNSYDVTLHPDSSDEELMGKLKGEGAEGEAEEDSEDEEEEEEESEEGGDLSTFAQNADDCKLVLVVRTDLGMSKGKIAAQASHATLACYTHLLSHSPRSPNKPTHPLLTRWLSAGQPKIALQCASEDALLTLQAQALSVGLCARVIRDAGRTQIAAGSATVLGVGPGPRGVVDGVTGRLRLL